jgi:hypothetical protein
MTVTQLNLKARTATDGRMEPPETATQRIRRLQLEAKSLAREQVEAFCDDLALLASRAADIAEGGDAYPAGVRDMASRLASELPDRAQSLLAISERLALSH